MVLQQTHIMPLNFDFKTTKGKVFSFSIPEPADIESFFLFSLPKAGSTLLMNIMTDVCKELHIPTIDLSTHLFNLGIAPTEIADDIKSLWQDRGYGYIGFRMLFPAQSFDFSKTKNILLIRDPRDMLVSLYFSLKYSHTVPKLENDGHPLVKQREAMQNSEIDKVVLNMAQNTRNHFEMYIKNLPVETTRVYRYEDIIFKKKEWLEDMLNFLELTLKNKQIDSIVKKYDIVPDRESPNDHIRQVIPGNYKIHLSKDTINKLNEIFDPLLHYFHYDSVVSIKIADKKETRSLQKNYDNRDYAMRLQHEFETMRTSLSWRLTRPLRWLASFVKGK